LINGRGIRLISLLVGLIVCALLLPVDDILKFVQDWARFSPQLAKWLVGITFLLAVLLLLPVAPIVMLAGLMFGLINGFLLIWVAGFVSSTLAFWCGRTIARPLVERRIKHRNTLAALDVAIRNNGMLVVLLTRLSIVIPFGPLNYSLSLTGLRFRDYLVATNIGMIPSYFLSVYLGTTAVDIAQILSGEVRLTGSEWAITLSLAFVVLVSFIVIVRLAFVKLRKEVIIDSKEECDSGKSVNCE